MINIFNRITKDVQEQLFYEAGILNSEGRLTEEGREIFTDLLFLGKTTEEAKVLIEVEIKKMNREKHV